MPVTVRPATEADSAALAGLDYTYPAGRRLHLGRSGEAPEHTFTPTSGFNDRMHSNQDDAPGRPTIYLHLELG